MIRDEEKEILNRYGEPIIRFKPHGKFTREKRLLNSVPSECMVFKIKDEYPAGLVVYSRYGRGEWVANSGERYVIRELLRKK